MTSERRMKGKKNTGLLIAIGMLMLITIVVPVSADFYLPPISVPQELAYANDTLHHYRTTPGSEFESIYRCNSNTTVCGAVVASCGLNQDCYYPVTSSDVGYYIWDGYGSTFNCWVNVVGGTRPTTVTLTGNPTYGYAPLSTTLTLNNMTYRNQTAIQWSFGDGNITTTNGLTSISHTYDNVGYYTIRADYYDNGPANITNINYIHAVPTSNITMFFQAQDAKTLLKVSVVDVGIKNTSSGVWRNVTGVDGNFYFKSTGINYEYPLTYGQVIGVDVRANGYEESYNQVTVQAGTYTTSPYPILVTKSGDVMYNGTWSLVAYVTDNSNGKPLPGVNLILKTGLNGWCTNGCSPTTYNPTNGAYSFWNVTASTIADLTLTKSNYVGQEDVISISYPSNYTTVKHYSLVPIGLTATPTPTFTIGPGNGSVVAPVVTGTGQPYPTPTDANGNPITSGEGKGFAAFGLLIDAAYAIMGIVVGLIFIWLLWMTVYMITGGKIIDKIMKRGRR